MTKPPDDFSGREEELNALKKWLQDDSESPFVISGTAGVGKSALAAKFAEESKAKMPVEWVSLYESPNTAVVSISEKMREGSSSLIVLDGLDELPGNDATTVIKELSTGLSSKRVLLTSRYAPEHLNATSLELRGLSPTDARILLSKTSGLSENSHEMAELATALGNHPLAIKLAASLLKETSITELLAELENKPYELEKQVADPPEKVIRVVEPAIVLASDFLVESIRKNPSEVYNLPPRKFEELIATLLDSFGWDVHLTPETRDGGKDILAYLDTELGRILCLVEAKRYRADRPVGVGVLRNLYGTICDEKANWGLLVTTSYFSGDAKAFREKHIYELNLKDYNGLISWVNKYKRS